MFNNDFNIVEKDFDKNMKRMFGWGIALSVLGAVMGLGLTGVVIWAIIRLVGKF
jgi:hypothetical protein